MSHTPRLPFQYHLIAALACLFIYWFICVYLELPIWFLIIVGIALIMWGLTITRDAINRDH